MHVAEQELVWCQNRAARDEHELRAGETLVATLRQPSVWRSAAAATTANGSWTFDRVGIWRMTSTIRDAGTGAELGRFEPRWTGTGLLNLASGARYRWDKANFWATQYVWRDDLGQDLVRFRSTRAC